MGIVDFDFVIVRQTVLREMVRLDRDGVKCCVDIQRKAARRFWTALLRIVGYDLVIVERIVTGKIVRLV